MAGRDRRAHVENGRGPVIVKATCEFLKPIVYPATVAITLRLERVGRSSMTVSHEFRDDDDPTGVLRAW